MRDKIFPVYYDKEFLTTHDGASCGKPRHLMSIEQSRPLEDRIRDLCAKAISSNNDAEFRHIIEELREALREHSKRLKVLAHAKFAAGLPFQEQRRSPAKTNRIV
jgi:hypothetical protein